MIYKCHPEIFMNTKLFCLLIHEESFWSGRAMRVLFAKDKAKDNKFLKLNRKFFSFVF